MSGIGKDVAATLAHAFDLIRSGDDEAGAAACRRALALAPDQPSGWLGLGVAAARAARRADAVQRLSRSFRLAPGEAAALNLARAYLLSDPGGAGDPVQGLAAARAAVVLNPGQAALWTTTADALERLGRFDEGVTARRLAAQAAPADPDLRFALGAAAQTAGRFETAITALSAAARLRPAHPETWVNLGSAFKESDLFDRAAAVYRRALALDPAFTVAWRNLGATLRDGGDLDAAKPAWRRAARIRRDHAASRLALVMATLPNAAPDIDTARAAPDAFVRAVARLTAWAEERPEHMRALGEAVGAVQPFALAYRPGDHRAALSAYGDLAARARRPWAPVLPTPPAQPLTRRTRLAIVSGHVLGRHPVWEIILRGLIETIDATRFEVRLYCPTARSDAETDWARARCAGLIQGAAPAGWWAERILADAPDVVFYPEVGMDPVASQLAATRLAPVQAAGWGHPITTGLPDIDLYFSGELLEGAAADAHYRERLIRLPGVGAHTAPMQVTPQTPSADLAPLPADRNILRLIICQQPMKLDPADDDLIAQTVAAAGPCRLYLMRHPRHPKAGEAVRRRLSAALARRGIDPATLVEAPWLSHEGFHGLLDEMDLFLDMPAFSGYTTAWQATRRGLPIITLEGTHLRQRLAAGLARRIGITDAVAVDRQSYVDIAARLAAECRDPVRRAARRQALAAAAPLADRDARVAPAFEAALLAALAERGWRFQPPVVSASASAPPLAPPSAPTTEKQGPAGDGPAWRLLDADLHLRTLAEDYAPVGLLEMAVAPPRRALDVGCFRGGTGRWLRERFPGVAVTGIEAMERAAALARPAYERVIARRFEDIDLAAEGLVDFDLIVAADVLEHMVNPWRALERLRGGLATGGTLLVSLPNVRNLTILEDLRAGRWPYAGAGILDVSHLRFFTRASAAAMLEETGWRIVETRLNPDPRLLARLGGRDPRTMTSIDIGGLRLDGLRPLDAMELVSLQIFLRAEAA